MLEEAELADSDYMVTVPSPVQLPTVAFVVLLTVPYLYARLRQPRTVFHVSSSPHPAKHLAFYLFAFVAQGGLKPVVIGLPPVPFGRQVLAPTDRPIQNLTLSYPIQLIPEVRFRQLLFHLDCSLCFASPSSGSLVLSSKASQCLDSKVFAGVTDAGTTSPRIR